MMSKEQRGLTQYIFALKVIGDTDIHKVFHHPDCHQTVISMYMCYIDRICMNIVTHHICMQ